MGLILSTVLLGLLATLSPVTIVVFIMVLGTARARVNAAAFLIGWGTSLVVVFLASYLLGTSRRTQHGSGRTGVLVLELLMGGALLVAGARRWRRRAELPVSTNGWRTQMMARTTDLTPRGAAVVGVLKQPWAITAAAAVVVVHYDEPRLVTLIAFACFAVASTASVAGMFAYYTLRPSEAQAYLSQLRDRAIASGPSVFAGAASAVGAFLVVDSLIALRS